MFLEGKAGLQRGGGRPEAAGVHPWYLGACRFYGAVRMDLQCFDLDAPRLEVLAVLLDLGRLLLDHAGGSLAVTFMLQERCVFHSWSACGDPYH